MHYDLFRVVLDLMRQGVAPEAIFSMLVQLHPHTSVYRQMKKIANKKKAQRREAASRDKDSASQKSDGSRENECNDNTTHLESDPGSSPRPYAPQSHHFSSPMTSNHPHMDSLV